jgi:hypothetical protein
LTYWLFRGWVYQTIVIDNRYLDEDIISAIDLDHNRINVALLQSFAESYEHRMQQWSPYNYLLFQRRPVATYLQVISQVAFSETEVEEAAVACALERYWQAHGEYPETLNALVPQFLPKFPNDITTGTPLRYEHTANGRFALRNAVEISANSHGGDYDIGQNHWIWQYPEK